MNTPTAPTTQLTIIVDKDNNIISASFEQTAAQALNMEVPAWFRELPAGELTSVVRAYVSRPSSPADENGTRELTTEQIVSQVLQGTVEILFGDIYGHEITPIDDIARPVVVVPGILGSDLWTQKPNGKQGLQIWPPYTARNGDFELTDVTKLDPTVAKVAVAGAIFQGVYGELLAALRNMGYTDNPPQGEPRTLWTFPYDWTPVDR